MVNTNPAAHSKQTKGTIITLYISSGMTKIPDGLVGQAKDSVIAQLKQAGLTQITIESEYSDSVQSGAVTRIDPGSGSTVEAGTAVTIWVSTGKQQVSVPFVANSTLAEAKSILEAAGFQVSVNGPQDDDATVVSMSPNGGSQADSGSTITLTTKKSSSDTPAPTQVTATTATTNKATNKIRGGSGSKPLPPLSLSLKNKSSRRQLHKAKGALLPAGPVHDTLKAVRPSLRS